VFSNNNPLSIVVSYNFKVLVEKYTELGSKATITSFPNVLIFSC